MRTPSDRREGERNALAVIAVEHFLRNGEGEGSAGNGFSVLLCVAFQAVAFDTLRIQQNVGHAAIVMATNDLLVRVEEVNGVQHIRCVEIAVLRKVCNQHSLADADRCRCDVACQLLFFLRIGTTDGLLLGRISARRTICAVLPVFRSVI